MNSTKTFGLLIAMLAVFMGFGFMLDRALGTGGKWMMIATIMALVMNWVSYFYSDKIVLKMYGAQEVSREEAPELHEIVERIAQRAGIPKPKVCIVPSDDPNAFATGRDPAHAVVAANQGLLRLLNRDEVEAVMAHEIGHVRNRDTLVSTVAATIAGAVSMLAQGAQMGLLFGGGGHRDREEGGSPLALVGVLLMVILAPIAAMMVQFAISRTREFGADRAASEFTGNPMALASALRKLEQYARGGVHDTEVNPATAHMFIVNPLSGGGMSKLFSTHPPTEERIAHLEEIARGNLTGRGAVASGAAGTFR